MRVAIVDGMLRSPKRTSARTSICLSVESSDCETLKSLLASSVTNFTLRSGPTTTPATPAAMRTFATEVMAGVADSRGKGRIGALGKGSRAGAVASVSGALLLPASEALFASGASFASGPLLVSGALLASTTSNDEPSRAGAAGAGSAPAALSAGFPFAAGVLHFSQRIPAPNAAPPPQDFAVIGPKPTDDGTA